MADGQVVGNPERLRKFASAFELFRQQSDETYDGIKTQLAILSETWADEAFEHFCAQIIQSENLLLETMGEASRIIPSMIKRADGIETVRRAQQNRPG